jgi:hypothetical protein
MFNSQIVNLLVQPERLRRKVRQSINGLKTSVRV